MIFPQYFIVLMVLIQYFRLQSHSLTSICNILVKTESLYLVSNVLSSQQAL